MPPGRIRELTLGQRQGKLGMAHGRVDSRVVRRRGGGASRRYFAPSPRQPGVGYPTAHTSQDKCRDSFKLDMRGRKRREPKLRSTDRGMAQLALP